MNILKGAWAGRVLDANDFIVINAFRNGRHFFVDRACFGNVTFSIFNGRGRNCASSCFGYILLRSVSRSRWNCSTRLSIQSVFVIRNVALCCWFNCPCLKGGWVKQQFPRNRILASVCCSCFDDLRARLSVCENTNCMSENFPRIFLPLYV